MKQKTSKFTLEVEGTKGRCPIGETVGQENMDRGKIPVFSCEGACIRGEIARQAANMVARQEPYRRGCHGELFAVPHSATFFRRLMRRYASSGGTACLTPGEERQITAPAAFSTRVMMCDSTCLPWLARAPYMDVSSRIETPLEPSAMERLVFRGDSIPRSRARLTTLFTPMAFASLTVTTLRDRASASRSVVGPKNLFSKFVGFQYPEGPPLGKMIGASMTISEGVHPSLIAAE